MLHPEYLYKYRSVADSKELNRLIDIIQNKKIYLSQPKNLNDPMEANSLNLSLGVAGSGYMYESGYIHSYTEGLQNKYSILSLSAIFDSTVMWAHYADEYKGCCLIFNTDGTFSEVTPLIYTDSTFSICTEGYTDDEIDEFIRQSLLFKSSNWSYENEWRLIKKQPSGYVDFASNELCAVIIGERMSQEYQDIISKVCRENNLPCFRTKVMKAFNKISFWPFYKEDEVIPLKYIYNYFVAKENIGKFDENEFNIFQLLNKKFGIDKDWEYFESDNQFVQEAEEQLSLIYND